MMKYSVESRSESFDNIKFVLIYLVFLGHFLECFLLGNTAVKLVYMFIYLFHMPMFVIVSGYYSSPTLTKEGLFSIVTRLLFPYVVFQSLMTFLLYLRDGYIDFDKALFCPHNVMWYLFCLAVWRLLLPVLTRLSFPLLFLTIVSLFSGCFGFDRFLSLSRLLVLMPLFYFGFMLRSRDGKVMALLNIPKIAALGIMVMAFIILLFMQDINLHWFYHDTPYDRLGVGVLQGIIGRFLLISGGMVVGFAFLSFIPKEKSIITTFGAGTIYVYLFHMFIVKMFDLADVHVFLDSQLAVFVFFLPVAMVLTVILSSKQFRFCVQPVVYPFNVVVAFFDKKKDSS